MSSDGFRCTIQYVGTGLLLNFLTFLSAPCITKMFVSGSCTAKFNFFVDSSLRLFFFHSYTLVDSFIIHSAR